MARFYDPNNENVGPAFLYQVVNRTTACIVEEDYTLVTAFAFMYICIYG